MSHNRRHPFRCEPTPAALRRARDSVRPLARAVRAARKRAGQGAMIVAWVSDIHLHAWREYAAPLSIYATEVDASANLQLALAEIGALEPDLVIFGGDIADSGCGGEAPPDEYDEMQRVLTACLPASVPSLPLLGNHDHADRPLSAQWHAALARTRRADWPTPVETDDFYYETRRGGWRFVALDSRQGQPLSDRQRAWLLQCLQADTATPTVVLVHRPFVSVGNWVDHCRLEDRRSFDLVDSASAVKAVLSGHTHKAAGWTYRGKSHVVFPACAYGIPDAPGWGVVVLRAEDVHSVFVKDLAATTFDGVAQCSRRRRGMYRALSRPTFECHPLWDPCTLPGPKR